MKKRPIIQVAIFLLFFLAIFLLREINLTGQATTKIGRNNAPELTTYPAINFLSIKTDSIIECLPGLYYDIDGDRKSKDYYKWYKNNIYTLDSYSRFLDLSVPGNGDPQDELRCSQAVSDGISNSTWRNSSAVFVASTTILPSVASSSTIMQEQEMIEQKPGSYTIFVVIAIVLIVAAASAAIFFMMKKKPVKRVKPESAKYELMNYIKKALERGYSLKQIEINLRKAGWPENMIKSALEEIK